MSDFKYDVGARECTSDEEETFVPNNPLERPPIRFYPCILAILGLAVLAVGSFFISDKVLFVDSERRLLWSWLICIGLSLVYSLVFAKKGVIWMVKVYQHYAPDSTRLRCAYEPSCSVYMIMAIEKYGLFIGVYKGIKRLFRCGPPGGIDYP